MEAMAGQRAVGLDAGLAAMGQLKAIKAPMAKPVAASHSSVGPFFNNHLTGGASCGVDTAVSHCDGYGWERDGGGTVDDGTGLGVEAAAVAWTDDLAVLDRVDEATLVGADGGVAMYLPGRAAAKDDLVSC
jgi:hypothetical protein